ncbi:MAG: hexose kinase [Eubacteriales bacterium]|nr:hexose kinase [Eubacteriales bacterium]
MTIHVLCLNPAIDKIYEIDGFAAGEDYPGQRPRLLVGGKGVNVARVLSQLGANVRLYAFLGETGGDVFRRDMQPRCACTFISVPGACRTTVNVIDRKSGKETVITEAGPEVSDAHVAQLLDALDAHVNDGDIVCCSGSVIAGAPEDIYARVSRLAQSKGARCALDCNAGAMARSLDGARYMLGKPNERELCAYLGVPRTQQPQEIARLARSLMPPYDALLVSMGEKGGVYVTKENAYLARVPKEPVVSTVGSGDAAFAGAVLARARGESEQETLRLAMACGAANALRADVGSVDPADVERILSGIAITRL